MRSYTRFDYNSSKNPKFIQAILFDSGGVIAEEGFFNALRELTEEQRIEGDLVAEAMDAVCASSYVLGHCSESDIWESLPRRTCLRGSDEELRQRVLAGFRLRPSMLDLVRLLRPQGYLVGLLSDQTEWLDHLDTEYGFYQEFYRLYISYRLGKGKRDPTLYNKIGGFCISNLSRSCSSTTIRVMSTAQHPEAGRPFCSGTSKHCVRNSGSGVCLARRRTENRLSDADGRGILGSCNWNSQAP